MPAWLRVNRDEHANRVQRDQCGDAPPERDDQDDATAVSEMIPVLERQAFAAELEDARQETVARGSWTGAEVGEGRVRGKHQQDRRRDLDEQVERRAETHERARDLADHGHLLGRVGHDPELSGEEADPGRRWRRS